MIQTAFYIERKDFAELLAVAFQNCEPNKEQWRDEVTNTIKNVVSNETAGKILFNHDGHGNVRIICFYDDRIRLYQCRQGTGLSNDFNKQFHVFDFLIPNSIEYMESVEANGFISTYLKVNGIENPFSIFVKSNGDFISPVVKDIYKI